MAWTVNFKACKRCSSGEYWLVSSGFTNTAHPVAAASRTRAWLCTPSCTPWSPWEGGAGSPRAVCPRKTGQRPAAMLSWPGGSGLALAPFPAKRLVAEASSPPALWAAGLCLLHPAATFGAVPMPACTSPGSRRVGWIVKETHSAMTSPDASPVRPASTWWLFSSRCCRVDGGDGEGARVASGPFSPSPTHPCSLTKASANHPKRSPHARASR